MKAKATTPEIALGSEGAMRASAHQLAARLALLDIDAATLEMVMAALTTDVCDHVTLTD